MGARGQAAEVETVRVDVRGVACRRGGQILFAGLDLALAPGEAALIAGPNGIGKSSLLRMLCGLLPAFAGSIAIDGRLALADDRLALDTDRPLARALAFWAGIDGQGDAAVSDAMAALALTPLADVPVRMFSTGQRKRAVLARVIASGAPIWLLDEPANGLDTASIALLGQAVEQHLAGGGIVIAASHQPLPWAQHATLSRGPMTATPNMGSSHDRRDHPARLRAQLGRGAAAMPIIFVLMVATLVPFALGPDTRLLSATGGGMLWIAALLASLLPVDRLIEPDRESGLFDQLVVRGMQDETIMAAKLVAHWLNFGPPLLLATLPAAALLQLPGDVMARLLLSLLIGTPGLAALALMTAALTAGLRGSSALTGLLILPLAVPLLIFGAGALGADSGAALKLLAAAVLVLVAIAPFAAGAAMRAGRE